MGRMMSSDEPTRGTELDDALNEARGKVNEIANLELAVNGHGNLSIPESHLLAFGVGQGWVTCLEFLSDAGYIDIDYK
jgi:hypothetical protein